MSALAVWSACSTSRAIHSDTSAVDALYREGPKQDESSTAVGVRVYRKSFRNVLGSHCQNFPTDSAYFVQAERSCGSLAATPLVISRMLNEYDMPLLGVPTVSTATEHANYLPFQSCSMSLR